MNKNEKTSLREFSFVGDNIEVEVLIDVDKKQAIQVCWAVWSFFLKDNNDQNSEEVEHRFGENSKLTCYAVNPQQAFEIAKRDLMLCASDEEEFKVIGI